MWSLLLLTWIAAYKKIDFLANRFETKSRNVKGYFSSYPVWFLLPNGLFNEDSEEWKLIQSKLRVLSAGTTKCR
jgi:hypothetical protein